MWRNRWELLLQHHLKKLRLPTFNSEYAKLARQCAAEGKDHVQYLLRLCELELIERERRMIERRIKAAKFPVTKSLDGFDFKAIPSLNKALTMELARCEFADRRENIIALGPSGTGKTHIALGLGLAACQKGLKVRFTTAAALVHELVEAVDERRLQRLQKTLASQDLLIIDELGFVPLSKTGADHAGLDVAHVRLAEHQLVEGNVARGAEDDFLLLCHLDISGRASREPLSRPPNPPRKTRPTSHSERAELRPKS